LAGEQREPWEAAPTRDAPAGIPTTSETARPFVVAIYRLLGNPAQRGGSKSTSRDTPQSDATSAPQSDAAHNQVLEVLRKTMPIESALTMRTEADELAPPHAGYQKAFGDALEIGSAGRWEFYDLARGADLAVLIASGDQRPCANLLLTVGVRPAQ